MQNEAASNDVRISPFSMNFHRVLIYNDISMARVYITLSQTKSQMIPLSLIRTAKMSQLASMKNFSADEKKGRYGGIHCL